MRDWVKYIVLGAGTALIYDLVTRHPYDFWTKQIVVLVACVIAAVWDWTNL